ncbi:Uncharacterised protein [Mycobacteroides abscessus subsp. abscessus]|nr:Uncharacterised protein [Mycobacteroides abscessus subsp. abscessus]SKY33464.1 Uncharacterised protein [Mycobacteroides abscessus subsp. abscessus]
MVIPRSFIFWARSWLSACTCSGVWVAANSRADGAGPMRSFRRDTRPPSSSILTAAGMGPAVMTSCSEPSVSISFLVQLPTKMPPT